MYHLDIEGTLNGTIEVTFRDILRCLAQHGCILSVRHLRRIFAKKKLCRRKFSDIDDVASFVNNELKISGQQHGYRFMWQKLKDNGLNAPKDDVRLIIRCLDPEGVVFRKARKLHRVNITPRVTELYSAHRWVRQFECIWEQLRNQCAEYWIVFLFNLEDTGNFAGDFDKKRPELRGNPSGRPLVMYEFPSLFGARSNQTDIISGELENQEDLVLMRTSVPADDDMFQLCCHTVAEHNLTIPSSCQKPLALFEHMRPIIRISLNI
ncbi:hypothetical protein CAPTEDRAFT_194425 [Capitella teleta]|uniref:Uncharacterized protein n=1 Tax=Capitella teleta TaxID=283909 RepID=R7UC56_CAPTE|nr:hypothetical protein CAPTEDRAFT_194425 [Capitella teleta]|eukprot:ELU00852.1 hypothetical protein CAPTEDRAFT_194425 [Capitella teleta]